MAPPQVGSQPPLSLPHNEAVLGYEPGSSERQALKDTLAEMSNGVIEVPLRIGADKVQSGRVETVVLPHHTSHTLGIVHNAGEKEVAAAVDTALATAPAWAETPLSLRRDIFLRAATLAAGPYRQRLNAATMLGQSKTCHQAEIDSACELIDFLRWNVHFAERIYAEQPISVAPTSMNSMDARPLEGFVLAVAPFNFTAIAANLCISPAIMGNVIVLKPARSAAVSAHVIMELLEEAGLPPGVINFLPGDGAQIVGQVLAHPQLAGIHFTGSTAVFRSIWEKVGANLGRYKSYPRLVGETGGKNFVVVHPSADVETVATAIVRGGFEYQGQKCSAAARIYVPAEMWRGGLAARLADEVAGLTVGDVADFRNFMGAVIDDKAHRRIKEYLHFIESASGYRLLAGGLGKTAKLASTGSWFIAPTLVETADPRSRLMTEEIFGPVVTVYPYEGGAAAWSTVLSMCDSTSDYGLTGAVLAGDRRAIEEATRALRQSAGNFYINDKPTGAVVGQQPFGGGRASGTNDKAGSLLNLWRWVSPRIIKENLSPPRDYRYPWMMEP